MEELIVKQHNELVENPEFDYSYKLVATTTETTDEKFYEEIESMVPTRQYTEIAEYGGERFEQKIEREVVNIQTRGKRVTETKSFYAIISFLAFYVALIFVMATATLLAIQQLSDSEKYKYRYELLKN